MKDQPRRNYNPPPTDDMLRPEPPPPPPPPVRRPRCADCANRDKDGRCHYLPAVVFRYENVTVHPLVIDDDWCVVGYEVKT